MVLLMIINAFATSTIAQELEADHIPQLATKNVKMEAFQSKTAGIIKRAGTIEPTKIPQIWRFPTPKHKRKAETVDFLTPILKKKEARKKELETLGKSNNTDRESRSMSGGVGVTVEKSVDFVYALGDPPDNTVAISNSGFIVAADSTAISFYREDGVELRKLRYEDFFGGLDILLNPIPEVLRNR